MNIFYLCFYLKHVEGVTSKDWETKYPNIIPMITMFGVLGMVLLITAIWDVWGFYSIPMVILMKLGLIMTADFAPGGTLGRKIEFYINF